jgi:hypothetical protein
MPTPVFFFQLDLALAVIPVYVSISEISNTAYNLTSQLVKQTVFFRVSLLNN